MLNAKLLYFKLCSLIGQFIQLLENYWRYVNSEAELNFWVAPIPAPHTHSWPFLFKKSVLMEYTNNYALIIYIFLEKQIQFILIIFIGNEVG